MSLSNSAENDLLKMICQGTDPAWRASPTAYLALYTADPGEAGTAVTNEATFTGYARIAITKATAWDDAGSTFANAALAQWPACTAGANTCTHWGIVTTASGAGQLLVSGAFTAALNISSGIQAQAAAGGLTVSAD